MKHLLVNLTHDSLLDTGPPAGWQIDGNFGGTAAIAEGLLQSRGGVVHVLLALMPSSKKGSFTGLRARGGFVVDAEWEDGRVISVEVHSLLGNPLKLRVGNGQSLVRSDTRGESGSETMEIETEKDSKYSFSGAS